MIISVINLIKGGVGKTTIAVNLAAQLVHEGLDVKIIDLDEAQGAAHKWAAHANVKSYFNPELKELSNIVQDKDSFLIFDTGGYDLVSTQALMSVSDVVLIPTSMSPIEVDAFISLMDKTDRIKKLLDNDNINLVVVPNRIDTRLKNITGESFFGNLRELGYKIAPTIHRRVIYEKSYANGGSVVGGSDSKARTEIYMLSEFVKECVSN